MTRSDALFLLNTTLDTIPQLYEADDGPIRHTFRFEGAETHRCSLRELGDPLLRYVETCLSHLTRLPESWLSTIPDILRYETVQQTCAKSWLLSQTGLETWNRILDYFLRTQRRTIENWAIAKSFIVDPTRPGPEPGGFPEKVDLFNRRSQRLIDWLATSPFTFLRVTPNLDFLSYEAISQFPKGDFSPDYIPDFLWPMAAQASQEGSSKLLLVDSNQRGDLLISDRHHIIASSIKGRWTIYDLNTLEHAIHNCLRQGEEIRDSAELKHLSHVLFRILFDVSFKRHGGLILVDQSLERVRRYAGGGVFADDPTQYSEIIPTQSYGEEAPNVTAIRKLIELTSIDGAVVLSAKGRMLGYGVMVAPHASALDRAGARTIAAKSAARHGAVAFSVSADGEILCHFKTRAYTGDAVHQMWL